MINTVVLQIAFYEFEKQIHENPDYYFWTHNRFKHRKN